LRRRHDYRARPASETATEAVKIDKPLEQITRTELSDALAPLAAQTGLPEPSSKPK
jgi:hypothetical protein